MSPASMIDRINDLVLVGNRIITYRAVSQELKVHVNAAKQYLIDYCDAQKALGIELEINYFLAGFVEVNGLRSVRVLVVSADHVDEAKMGFAELTSCHIYSVLRGFSKNDHALYSADYSYTQNIEDLNKYSAIQHPNIELKPPILTKMPPILDVKLFSSKKTNSSTIPNGKTEVDSKTGAKPDSESNKKNIMPLDNNEKDSKEKPDPETKSGTLMSMWQKKENSNTEKTGSKPEPKTKQASKNVPKNNIMSMFSKQAEKNLLQPPSKPEKKDIPINDLPRSQPSNKEPVKEVKKSSQKRKISSKKSNSSKSQQNSDSESETKLKPKKHRRICTFDSDSESEPEEEKEKAQRSFFLPEEPMETSVASPASEGEETIPPTPPIIKVKGKSKVWKAVQKTYEDDDGFFVTKTEKELVSASEDEEDPIKTEKKDSKSDKKEVKGKRSPMKHNKKQASLMSFFKQK